jgi:hypothetical protein
MGTSNNRHGSIRNIEEKRVIFQNDIDSKKDIEFRRHEGQFATPFSLAKEITNYGLSLVEDNSIYFLEPAVGTGAFISALYECANESHKNILQITGIEKDSDFFEAANNLWKNTTILNNNFFLSLPNPSTIF